MPPATRPSTATSIWSTEARAQVNLRFSPANCAAADSGTLLAELTFSDPAFGNGGASVTGRADANAITSDTNANNSGDAGHFRVYDSNDVCVDQGTAGVAADTPDLVFDDKAIVAGGTVACTSFQVTQPEQ